MLGHRGKHFLHDARQKNEVKKISVELCTPTSLSSSFSNYGSEKVMDRIEGLFSMSLFHFLTLRTSSIYF